MSAPDIVVIRRMLTAFNRGDFAVLEELDAEAELQDEPRIPGAGWNYGHQGAVDWAVKLWESFGRLAFDISEPVGIGPCLVVRWHASGRGKRSGAAVDMEGYCVFTMRFGKVWRVEFYPSQTDALEAARACR